jgi:hypothetical protein
MSDPTLPRIAIPGNTMEGDVCVGYLQGAGLVVLDAATQRGIDEDRVQLWDVAQGRFQVFDASVVREKFIPLADLLKDRTLGPVLSKAGFPGAIVESYLAAFAQPDEAMMESAAEVDRMEPEPEYDRYEREEDADLGDETELLLDEIYGDQDAWARSDEEGWYYDD